MAIYVTEKPYNCHQRAYYRLGIFFQSIFDVNSQVTWDTKLVTYIQSVVEELHSQGVLFQGSHQGISQFLSDQGAVAVKMVTGCPRKIDKINICMKLAKIAFQLLMKIWDSVYISFIPYFIHYITRCVLFVVFVSFITFPFFFLSIFSSFIAVSYA